jgi:hypothetical protein
MNDSDKNHETARAAEPSTPLPPLAATARALLVDLEQRLPLGMGPLERALAARLREAIAQLVACAEQLGRDELMITGSAGRQRPHPLLKTLQELRRDISDGLKELTFRAEQRQLLARLQSAERARRLTEKP